ncbi:MAG: Dabb family protein [Planctomycetes bacterium]|nr:Dabb family protein [Planctomycetota bacterium]MBL7043216.1 Dabb family protein [Pirellulaceae bacterium]
MIDRMVFVRFKEEYRTDTKRAEIASHSENTLRAVPQVRAIRVATALDDKTRQDWDMLLAIRLDSIEDLEPFRLNPIHREYVDNYLKPKMAQIKGWNFS